MHQSNSYYAVIFSSKLKCDSGYAEMAGLLEDLAKQQKGFLGLESARNELGITVSYWESLEAIASWKAHTRHQIAQKKGKTEWYEWFKIRICKVEREYGFGL